MPPRGASTKLPYMVDSASEDELEHHADMMLTPDSAVENYAPGRRGKARASKPVVASSAIKVTKPKTSARRTSGESALGVKKEKAAVAKKPAVKRKVLAERPNMSDTEEVEEFEEDIKAAVVDVEPSKQTKGKRGRPRRDESVAEVPKPKRAAKASEKEQAIKAAPKSSGKASKPSKRDPSIEPQVVQDTQPSPDPMDIEQSIEIDAGQEVMLPPPRPVARQNNQARSSSQQRQPSVPHRRAGSMSDTERGGSDPTVRRRLGEMTKRFENVNLKYQNLKETGMRDKESNFDKLKRATDKREKDQDTLIQSLKQQIASLQSNSSDSSSLRKEIAYLTETNVKLQSENKTLTSSLLSTQNENKILSTKLAAARSSQPPESKTVPGSAVKQRNVVLPGSVEAAKETQIRQLKEDLYSDLTGLIVRGVKRGDAEDVYDCIQTGRNGTLHFHLAVSSPDPEKPAYEDAEFAYTPLLDENRDKDLLDILPDYLTEEICFPRSHAAKFYAKVVDCMTKRIVVEE